MIKTPVVANLPKAITVEKVWLSDIIERFSGTLKLLHLVQLAADIDTTDEGQAISNGIHRAYNELWDLVAELERTELQRSGEVQ